MSRSRFSGVRARVRVHRSKWRSLSVQLSIYFSRSTRVQLRTWRSICVQIAFSLKKPILKKSTKAFFILLTHHSLRVFSVISFVEVRIACFLTSISIINQFQKCKFGQITKCKIQICMESEC